MSVTAEDIVVNLIKLNGPELKDQTRLQREAYLLDRCGAKFGLSFVYHHYGPYSSELVEGWTDAHAEGRIDITEESGRYGVLYSIFRRKELGDPDLGELAATDARERLQKMDKASDIVLELAAAIVYLREVGYAEQTIKELKMRKPLKATKDGSRKPRLCSVPSVLKKRPRFQGPSKNSVCVPSASASSASICGYVAAFRLSSGVFREYLRLVCAIEGVGAPDPCS